MNTQSIALQTETKSFATYFTYSALFIFALVQGLALTRILFEWLFPNYLWLGRPYFVLPFSIIIATLLIFTIHHSPFTIHHSYLTFSPFLLNLLWLFNPTVDLIASRFIFAASLWLTAVLITRGWGLGVGGWKWLGISFVWLALAPVYLLTMSHAVGAADTFEFQVVTPKLGIVHPTGYPLYLILGKLFTLLPLGTMAWRLNFASVIYALLAIGLFYLLMLRMTKRPLPAILGAVVTGLTITFWSQAIIAEVYALHALVVMLALVLMAEIGDWRLALSLPKGLTRRRGGAEGSQLKANSSAVAASQSQRAALQTKPPDQTLINISKQKLIIILAFVIGLGMTNHVTSVFLIPPAILTVLLTHHASRITSLFKPSYLLKLMSAFLIPLLLYAYLPLRWQAVNGEPMGLARFVDWVVAGRFQGALQLRAWFDDPTRYQIILRLFLDNWGYFNLALAAIGFAILIVKNWRIALILFSLWFGYTFYTLNYYVPDLAVFVIPAQIIVGICWGIAVWGIGDWLPAATRLEITQSHNLQYFGVSQYKSLIFTLIIIPTLLLSVDNWTTNDQSANDGLEGWGRAVLNLPLAENGAILADGEKIAPLNYLQVAEGLRPDLDISVWPDEAAYRGQVDGRIANGQTVYLARQLPNLQSIYHLRAVGPLTEVSNYPITQLPNLQSFDKLQFGNISLLNYEIHPTTTEPFKTAVTFYWQAQEPINDVLHIYTRFKDTPSNDGQHPSNDGQHPSNDGQHPSNNFYPTNAWKGDEIVSDYHELTHPILSEAETAELQITFAPPFSDPNTLNWQTVTQVELPATTTLNEGRPYRAQVGYTLIETSEFPLKTRPDTDIPITISGYGDPNLSFSLTKHTPAFSPINKPALIDRSFTPFPDFPFTNTSALKTDLDNDQYFLVIKPGRDTAFCGWMDFGSNGCTLGKVEISGVALPETAVNFEDKIALLDVDIPNPELQAGGQLQLTLNWLTLADMAEDYTVTVQVLDANDRLVGQTDSWPVQGTRPTSQWQAGETIADPYTLYLDSDLPAGEYRLLVGIYLLGNGRRLPVVNDDGLQIDDKVIKAGLAVP